MVEALLERQLDAEPDRDAAGLAGALVGRLHRAGAAAGDHREAGLGQRRARAPRPWRTSASSRRGAGRAEHADRRAAARPARRSPRRTRTGCAAPATGRCAPSRWARGSSSSRWSVVRRRHLCRARSGDRARAVLAAVLAHAVVRRSRARRPTRPAVARQASHRSSARPRRRPAAATGTRSWSCVGEVGSPGPKFTAGTPSAANRATSVQPELGPAGAADRRDERRGRGHGAARAGRRRRGVGDRARRSPSNTSRTWAQRLLGRSGPARTGS